MPYLARASYARFFELSALVFSTEPTKCGIDCDQGKFLLADSRLAEAKACFAKCAEDNECQALQVFTLISQHRYEEAASAIRRISGRAGLVTSDDMANAKALALIKLGDVQSAIYTLGKLPITTYTSVACTAGAVYWMDGDMASAANALHACAAFSHELNAQLVSLAGGMVRDE